MYTEAVKGNQPPHIVFDTTVTNVASETVKSLAAALGLPTVSASFGQEGDLRQWRDLNEQKRQYLLQVMPPTDIIPEVIRSIIIYMNITNAAILYDESFGKWLMFIFQPKRRMLNRQTGKKSMKLLFCESGWHVIV